MGRPRSGASGACSRGGRRRSSSPPTRELEAKVRDVVGLYLNPPEKAVVLCVDEKSQVQALDRTAPILPMRPGLPEKADPRLHPPRHHHLFAALEVATGQVERGLPAAAPPPGVPALPQAGRQGLPAAEAAPGRATTTPPTSTPPCRPGWPATRGSPCTSPRPRGSWLNMVEIFFGDHHPPGHPPRQLRRSVNDLIAAIRRFIDGWNERCQPFVWTKTADELLDHSRPGQRTSFTRH